MPADLSPPFRAAWDEVFATALLRARVTGIPRDSQDGRHSTRDAGSHLINHVARAGNPEDGFDALLFTRLPAGLVRRTAGKGVPFLQQHLRGSVDRRAGVVRAGPGISFL